MATFALAGFPGDLERDYQDKRIEQVSLILAFGAVTGSAAFIGLALWDAAVDAAAAPSAIPIRISCAAIMATVGVASFLRRIRRIWVLVGVAAWTLAIGFGLIMTYLDGGTVAGVSGLVIGIGLIPMLSTTHGQAAFHILSLILLPNLVFALRGSQRFEIVNLNVWLATAAAFAGVFWLILDKLNRRLHLAERDARSERERADRLLFNVFPAEIARALKQSTSRVARYHDSVTVLFADIVGFTSFAQNVDADDLVDLLDSLFEMFDEIVDELSIAKIKTIGDGYMAVAGAPVPDPSHAEKSVELGRAMLKAAFEFCEAHSVDWNLRIGIHSGPVVAGVIGRKRLAYDLWGDTVNVASRLESTAPAGKLQISRDTMLLLPHGYALEDRGVVELKNHGSIETYLLGVDAQPGPIQP